MRSAHRPRRAVSLGRAALRNGRGKVKEIRDALDAYPTDYSLAVLTPVGTAFIELVSASNGAVVDLGRTLMIFPSRIRMISNVDHTIRRR